MRAPLSSSRSTRRAEQAGQLAHLITSLYDARGVRFIGQEVVHALAGFAHLQRDLQAEMEAPSKLLRFGDSRIPRALRSAPLVAGCTSPLGTCCSRPRVSRRQRPSSLCGRVRGEE
eukprot:scaffold290_cov367-Pinguiococcus_pyrenoidosus.AAC.4